ncbi:MAG: AraC family transcriptional regulator [Rhodothermales bacterium]|jgi:AraC family transcriptional regulator
METPQVLCKREAVVIGKHASERFVDLSREELRPLSKAGVAFAGYGVERETYEIQRHAPKWHVLIFSIDGEGWLKTGGGHYRLCPGDVWAAPAGVPHHYGLTGASWTIAWLCFRCDNTLGVHPTEPRVIHSQIAQQADHAIRQVIDEADREGEDSPQMIAAHGRVLQLLCMRTARFCGSAAPDHRRVMLEKAFDAVRATPGATWTVSALLKASGLPVTGDRLRQLCQQHFGLSPMRYVTQIRMQQARELLSATDYCVYTIAAMLGYGNEAAFSTAFRRENGYSPRAYRQARVGDT